MGPPVPDHSCTSDTRYVDARSICTQGLPSAGLVPNTKLVLVHFCE